MIHRSFYFLRHGETDWNRRGIMQGFTDIPLNETGRAQARAAVDLFAGLPIDRIVASPLMRAHETAKIVNEKLQKPITLCEGLRERHFGAFEGKAAAEIEKLKEELGLQGLPPEENGYPCPPGAESYEIFKARIVESLNTALHGHAENVLFVCHGGIYRVLRRSLLGDLANSGNVEPFLFEKGADGWAVRALAA